jgi:hypothetical protein
MSGRPQRTIYATQGLDGISSCTYRDQNISGFCTKVKKSNSVRMKAGIVNQRCGDWDNIYTYVYTHDLILASLRNELGGCR